MVVVDHFMGEPTKLKEFHTKSAAEKFIRDNPSDDAFSELRVKPVLSRIRPKLPKRIK